MSIKAETLHQAEAELEFLRKTQVEKNEIRKNLNGQKTLTFNYLEQLLIQQKLFYLVLALKKNLLS